METWTTVYFGVYFMKFLCNIYLTVVAKHHDYQFTPIVIIVILLII